MRSKEEVREKFDELRVRMLAHRKDEFLSRDARNCISNVRLRVKGHGKCGFCRSPKVMSKTKGAPFVCDEEGTALRCPYYECRNTPESVERDFHDVLKSPSRCGNEYPKLAILIWFLQETKGNNRPVRLWKSICGVVRSLSYILLLRWW